MFMYVDDIAKHAQVYPDYFSLLIRNPYHWFIATFSPHNGAQYRLNETDYEHKAIATMQAHRTIKFNYVYHILFFILRLIWFDFWLKLLEVLKYKIQTASWWPSIRCLPPVRAANWIWCIPKRFLFDNKTVIKGDPKATRTTQRPTIIIN